MDESDNQIRKPSDTLVQRMAQRVDPDKYKRLREGSSFFGGDQAASNGPSMLDALRERAKRATE